MRSNNYLIRTYRFFQDGKAEKEVARCKNNIVILKLDKDIDIHYYQDFLNSYYKEFIKWEKENENETKS